MKQSLFLAASFASLSQLGCAGTTSMNGFTGDLPGRPAAHNAATEIDLSRASTIDAQAVHRDAPVFAEAATLPSADRLGGRIRSELGGTAMARIDICVAPSGAVQSVKLEQSSNMRSFDEAVVSDAASWRYQAFAAPSTIRVCEPFSVAYVIR